MSEHHPIHQWPEAERPRERLLEHGAARLSDAELLALLIGSGTRGRSAAKRKNSLSAASKSLAAKSCMARA